MERSPNISLNEKTSSVYMCACVCTLNRNILFLWKKESESVSHSVMPESSWPHEL